MRFNSAFKGLTPTLDARWVVNATTRLFYPPGKTRYPLYRRLGGHQGRSGRARKISPPPEFDPQTAQPVASRYTVWVIKARDIIMKDKW